MAQAYILTVQEIINYVLNSDSQSLIAEWLSQVELAH